MLPAIAMGQRLALSSPPGSAATFVATGTSIWDPAESAHLVAWKSWKDPPLVALADTADAAEAPET